MLTHIKEIVEEKVKNQTAAGAFNTFNLEVTQGIVSGIKKSNLPAIIQVTEKSIKYAGLEALYCLIKKTIEKESGDVPIAIHLDHGKNLEVLRACVELGFSSVHMDASEYSFEENIKLTKEAVEIAKEKGVWVQGELGNIYGKEGLIKMQQGEDLKKLMTNPEQIKEFIERTGVNTVAVSIGSMHGNFVGEENIDFARLKKITKEIDIPIVLHGGSGVEDKQVKKAIGGGVRVINVDTDLRIAFTNSLKQTIKMEGNLVDPREVIKPSIEAVSQVVEKKANLFNI